MNKRMIKIFSIILIAMIVISISVNSFAIKSPNQLNANTSTNGGAAVTNVGQSVMGILQTTGIVISVIVLIILGIKYMMGSAEEKAEYKKTLLPYIIGAALVFAASSIATIIFNFTSNIG